MTTRRKVLFGLALAVGMPLVNGVIGYALLSFDSAPFDDSDLAPVRLDVPEGQNAHTYFERAIETLDLDRYIEEEATGQEEASGSGQSAAGETTPQPPAEDAPQMGGEVGQPAQEEQEEQDAWADYPRCDRGRLVEMAGGEWDEAFAARVLEQNAEAFALWEQGLACPHFQAPQKRGIEALLPRVFGYLDLARLADVRARAHARRGDHVAALEDAMKLVRFGHAVQGARGSFMHYLVGLTVKRMGLDLMLEFAVAYTLPPQGLRALASDLGAYAANVDGLAHAFRYEYAAQKDIIDDIASGALAWGDIAQVQTDEHGPPGPAQRFFGRLVSRPVLKPNGTKRLFADTHRRAIGSIPKRYKDMPEFAARFSEAGALRNFLSGNLCGRALHDLMLPTVRLLLERKCQENMHVAGTRILLAMKAYSLEKGALPARLEDLVPGYLDAVPLDDFDGKPMRYNRDRKLIYSVGKDLQDSGGTTLEDWVAAKRRKIEEEGGEWTECDQAWAEALFWQSPDPSYLIEF